MRRAVFYPFLTGLVILNGFLLSKPNLLGKIGLIVYKYHYLRTFPRTLFTVTVFCGAAVGLSELLGYLVRRRAISHTVGTAVFALLVALGFAQLIRTGLDFNTWTYSHTGLRFRLGAFMLPVLVICIFVYGWFRLPRRGELQDTSVEEVVNEQGSG